MRVARALVAVLALAACASSRLPGRTDYGVYRFNQIVPDSRPLVTLTGFVQVLPDTITISSSTGPCAYVPNSKDARTFSYTCGSAVFSFNRLDPWKHNVYWVRTQEIAQVRYCHRYTMRNGVDVCSEYRTRAEPRETTRSGRLTPTKP